MRGISKLSQLIALALCAVLIAISFAGCGKTEGEKTTEEVRGDSDTAAQTEPETQGGTDDGGFDYSSGIGDDGYLIGIKALDLVRLAQYKGIPIPSSDHTVTEDELGEQLSSLLSNFKQTVQVTDRAVENGDKVNIDYIGSVDGVEFSGGNTQGQGTDVTAGSKNYIDDFLTQIIGHMPGETFDVVVTFPDPYDNNPDLSGKEAVFVTTINYISEQVDPELTDEFVKENLTENYHWESADEVRDYFRSIIRKRKLHLFIDEFLKNNSTVSEVPEALVEYQKNSMLGYYESRASQYGMTIDDLVTNYYGFESVDAFVEEQKEEIENAALSEILIQAVAENEGLRVTEEDVNSFILASYLSVTEENLPTIKDYYGLPYWAQETLANAVYEFIIENAELN